MPTYHGGPGSDSFTVGDGVDELWGGGGSDVLRGGGGNDSLYADQPGVTSAGEETTVNLLYGEAGDDFIVGGAGKDTLDGGDGDDTISGGSGDTLLGGAGNDWLMLATTASGATVDGGTGDDRIDMGAGPSRYTGGVGADRFTLLTGGQVALGASTITDFNAAQGDRLNLGTSQLLYAHVFRGALDNANFSLKIGDTFSSSDYGSDVQQVWTWVSGGDTYLIADVDGSRTLSASDIVIRFTGLPTLDAAAFVDGSFSTQLGTSGADTYASTKIGDRYYGLDGDDTIRGSAGDDQLHGGRGADQINGGGGADLIWGGDGDDRIDGGGGGRDVAVYSGSSTDYVITRGANGDVRVQDLRGVDGVDTLTNIQRLEFADKIVAISYVLDPSVEAPFKAVLRASSEAPSQLANVIALSDSVTSGASTETIDKQIIKAAGATTSVASMSYEFFTGKVPGESGIDYLVSPTGPNAGNLNSAYYQAFSLENRYINFAVNLGKAGEGKDAFAAKYATLSLFDATREAYKTIFGGTPTDDKIHAMIDSRADYFASYGGDGVGGIGTKAAMVGWLLGEAIKADVGVMARSNDAWLMDLAADGSAPFAIDILDPAKGYYKADFVFGG